MKTRAAKRINPAVMVTHVGGLADILDANMGLWCPEAEEYLLANFVED